MVEFFHDRETVRTCDEWHSFARRAGYARPGSSVWTTVRNYARLCGRAVMWRADDSAVEFWRDESGKVRRRTYKPASVRWSW